MKAVSDGPSPKQPRPTTTPRRVVVPLPVKRECSTAHTAELYASGLTDETIALASLYTELSSRAIAMLIDRSTYPRSCGAALVYPCFLPGDAAPYTYRIKATTPRVDARGSKPRTIKYDQSHRIGCVVYYPPRARLAGAYGPPPAAGVDPLRAGVDPLPPPPMYWTEGEKKALVLDQLGLPCIGLTGVENWIEPGTSHAEVVQLNPLIRDYVHVAARQHVIVFDADARTNGQVMRAACRLAGVLHAHGAASVVLACSPDPACKGIDDYFAKHGLDATMAVLRAATPLDPIDPSNPRARVHAVKALAAAPVPKACVLPDGYDVRDDGTLWRIGVAERQGGAQLISAAGPILIERYLEDLYTGEGRVDVTYQHHGPDSWTSQCISRAAMVDARMCVAELGAYGAPITSSNAGKTIDWLHALGAVNAAHIPIVKSVARVGWHDVDGHRAFVSSEPITARGMPAGAAGEVALDSRGDRKRLYSALRPRGDAVNHVAALREAWDADLSCALVIAAALAAPLLEPLSAPNFGVHLSGESSTGKTSMLRIGGSVYGDPHDPQWLASWNATGAGAELRAAMLSDLPQCYDEIGGGEPEALDRMVYMLINGTGRTRAQRDLALRETQHWRTVLISTGERDLMSDTSATGVRTRIINVPVAGFGSLSPTAIDRLRALCAANAGNFGRQWLQMLVDIDDWPAWRKHHADYLAEFQRYARDAAGPDGEHDPGIHARTAHYFATLATAEAMAHWIGFGNQGDRMIAAYQQHCQTSMIDSLADRARQLVEDWALSDPDGFPHATISTSGQLQLPVLRPGQRLRGFRHDESLYIIPSEFGDFCGRHRLASKVVIRLWERRGWARCDSGRSDIRVRVAGHRIRLVELLQNAELR